MIDAPQGGTPMAPSTGAVAGGSVGRGTRLRVWSRLLRPMPTSSTSWWESLFVAVGAAVIGYFRLGRAPLRGVVWAEDGQIFLADAHHTNLLTGAFKPYQGYALLEPRVLTEVVSWLPLWWQGQLMSIVAALCTGGVALLAYHVVRAHAHTRVPPLLAAAVAAAPRSASR